MTEQKETMVECAARTAHEVNRAYCAGLGDYSQLPWAEAPEWQRASALAGAQAIIDNPATTPEQSHLGWYRQKLADGWKYGPLKDVEAKEHPCMVPYAELPVKQRLKDTLFGAAVRGAIAHHTPAAPDDSRAQAFGINDLPTREVPAYSEEAVAKAHEAIKVVEPPTQKGFALNEFCAEYRRLCNLDSVSASEGRELLALAGYEAVVGRPDGDDIYARSGVGMPAAG